MRRVYEGVIGIVEELLLILLLLLLLVLVVLLLLQKFKFPPVFHHLWK